jgi:hypothetical protein
MTSQRLVHRPVHARPHPLWRGVDVADDRLPALGDTDVLDRHLLLALGAIFLQRDICAAKVLVNLLNARSALSCCGMFQGLGDDSVMAFTDFGVESLVELIKIHRESTPTRER